MSEMTVITQTKHIIKIKVEFRSIDQKKLLKYLNAEKFNGLCRENCKNYGGKWACPPYTPKLDVYSEDLKYVLLALFYVDFQQFEYIGQNYLKLKAANSILKSRIDRFNRILLKDVDGKAVSSGSCRLCKPCHIKLGKVCNKPNLMAPSLEAFGIDVEKLSIDVFGHELLWYRDKILPLYTSVLAGVMTQNEVPNNTIVSCLKKVNE